MTNEWLVKWLATGHPAVVSQLVGRMRKDPESMNKHEGTHQGQPVE